jgi:pantetheine-phosphate adenylyltransferase
LIIVERPLGDKNYFLPQGLYTLDSRDYGRITLDVLAKGDAVVITGTFDPYTIGHDFLVETAINKFECVHIVLLDNPEKEPSQPKKIRMKHIEHAVRRYKLGRKIKVREYDGLSIDYCKSNDIRYIIRGFRNDEDLIYEKNMAEWNLKHGNIETILIEARDKEVSSSEIRRKIKAGEDVSSWLVGD